jgi:NADH-quinone oxidoreductase subunit C
MSPEDRRRAQDAPIVPPAPGSVADLFTEALPDVEIVASQGLIDVILFVYRKDIHRVLEAAKHHPKLAFDFLRNLTGMDYEDQGLEVVYHLYSFANRQNVTIRCKVPVEDPTIASATDLWRAADWHEREARDMFGIVFEGHPDLVPLLLPDDMLDHFPLRKDNPLAPLEEWQGEILGPMMGEAGHIPPGSGFEPPAGAPAAAPEEAS